MISNWIGKRLPNKWRKSTRQNLVYADLDISANVWLGKRFITVVAFSVAVFLFCNLLLYCNYIISAIFTVMLSSILITTFVIKLYLKGSKRAKDIEEVFPDALQLIAANIRAGMTPDRALWVSARPEFGSLEKEIRRIGSEMIGGETVEEAFSNMGKRIRSNILKRTVRLIVEGIESGGEIAILLTETADDIRALQLLDKEMKANVAMYTMFITFASLGGAPLLYGISTFFMEILSGMTSSIGAGTMATASEAGMKTMSINAVVSPNFLFKFAILVISITAFFAALVVGLIKKGDEKQGFVYAPLFVAMGLLVFWIVRQAIMGMFGGLVVL